jgi:hypothetical protein
MQPALVESRSRSKADHESESSSPRGSSHRVSAETRHVEIFVEEIEGSRSRVNNKSHPNDPTWWKTADRVTTARRMRQGPGVTAGKRMSRNGVEGEKRSSGTVSKPLVGRTAEQTEESSRQLGRHSRTAIETELLYPYPAGLRFPSRDPSLMLDRRRLQAHLRFTGSFTSYSTIRCTCLHS